MGCSVISVALDFLSFLRTFLAPYFGMLSANPIPYFLSGYFGILVLALQNFLSQDQSIVQQ